MGVPSVEGATVGRAVGWAMQLPVCLISFPLGQVEGCVQK